MYCFPEVSKCFVLDITEEGEPGMKQQERGISQFEHHSLGIIDGKNAVVQTNNWLIVGSVDRKDLHDNLANFHADFAVFAATKLPENAKFLSDQRGTDPQTDNGGDAQQRNGRLLELTCRNDALPVRKYHIINPAGCEYLVLCPPSTAAGTTCEDTRHITDWFYSACLCCPEHTHYRQCTGCQEL
ncbi:uncharacterized protein LOC118412488 [Branchiostoma floridae]|nr:uncharacterized protein LOC118412488 [Branchiostoma floridae]